MPGGAAGVAGHGLLGADHFFHRCLHTIRDVVCRHHVPELNCPMNILIVLDQFALRTREALATTLVETRLAACVNILAPARSIAGTRDRTGKEVPLLIKTTAECYPALEAAIRAQHPYETPETVAPPVTRGLPEYLGLVAADAPQPRRHVHAPSLPSFLPPWPLSSDRCWPLISSSDQAFRPSASTRWRDTRNPLRHRTGLLPYWDKFRFALEPDSPDRHATDPQGQGKER